MKKDSARRLAPPQALELAMQISASFQSAIQQADSKVAMLLVVHPGTSLLMLSQIEFSERPGPGPRLVVMVVTAVVFGAGFVMAGWHIVNALRPRTRFLTGENRFTFARTPAAQGPDAASLLEADVERLAAEAWGHAEVLARIAVVKNRHVLGAVRWLAPMVVASAVGMAVGISPDLGP